MGPLVGGLSGCITNWLDMLSGLKMGKEVLSSDKRKQETVSVETCMCFALSFINIKTEKSLLKY